MSYWTWLALLAGALASGALVVPVLVLPRRIEAFALLGIAVCVTAAYEAIKAITAAAPRGDVVATASMAALGAALAGYVIGSSTLARFRVRRPAVALPDVTDAGERIGVVLLTPAEPPSYTPDHLAEELAELADGGVPFPRTPLLPLIYAARREAYHTLGSSDAAASAGRIATRLQSMLDAASDRFGETRAASTSCCPRLTEAVADLAASGHARIVVATLASSRDAGIDRAWGELSAARPAEHGIRLVDAGPLTDARLLADVVVEKIRRVSTGPPADTGVVLLSPGRPPAWERSRPDAAERDAFVAARARFALREMGYASDNVVTAALEWSEPDVVGAIRGLAAFGCRSVIVAPATVPLDGIGTLVDLPRLVAHARRVTGVDIVILPAWNDDASIETALRDMVRAATDEAFAV